MTRGDQEPAPLGATAAGEWLFAQPCRFIAAAGSMGALPAAAGHEIAFAGRSNVGKSSLINALTRRHGLARVSGTPGRTQEIIFFDLAGRLRLVDLPGYGYAAAPRSKVDAWTDLIDAYLQGRPNLRRVCLLVDSRHGLKALDHQVMTALDRSAVVYQVVLTKCDKPGAELARKRAEVAAAIAKHPAAHPDVLTTSAVKGHGVETLRAVIAALLEAPAPREELGGRH